MYENYIHTIIDLDDYMIEVLNEYKYIQIKAKDFYGAYYTKLKVNSETNQYI